MNDHPLVNIFKRMVIYPVKSEYQSENNNIKFKENEHKYFSFVKEEMKKINKIFFGVSDGK